MQTTLAPNRITAIHGMVNGTCNYILTQMDADPKLEMSRAIADAQARGYAEPDPTFDVGGHDSAYKIAILASLAFDQELKFENVRLEGITALGAADFVYARENGLAVKLLASARQHPDGSVDLIVAPHFLPAGHVLAGVRNVFNAVLIQGDPIGDTMYYGAGAGRPSTASGLIADIMLAARTQRDDAPNPYPLRIPRGGAVIQDKAAIHGRHYVRTADPDASLRGLLEKEPAVVDIHVFSGETSFVTKRMTETDFDNLLGKLTSVGISSSSVSHIRFAFE
jgi:homoserine dehydrogenase